MELEEYCASSFVDGVGQVKGVHAYVRVTSFDQQFKCMFVDAPVRAAPCLNILKYLLR